MARIRFRGRRLTLLGFVFAKKNERWTLWRIQICSMDARPVTQFVRQRQR